MSLDQDAIERAIKKRIVEIVAPLGEDATSLAHDEVIPASGLVDSSGLIELIAWFDNEYRLALKDEEITIDNLGTIQAMARFVLRRKAA
jgi:D-alanine--poly(phosphoribitol) ligase subunit 2